ncbi:hypothetical protein P9210_07615 [Heyndrickxia coagulans]|uniref:hypothetical protein n=1 Tax=Heyndrickxia coagulans TaxID=1398 RepID=UPI000346D654|nr:hypothetical protein [Heyndrickxia coagulans]MED4312430.1 hypothetical protein [Heyndrickxia coagulans]
MKNPIRKKGHFQALNANWGKTLPAALTTAGATRNIIKIDGKIGKTDDKEE